MEYLKICVVVLCGEENDHVRKFQSKLHLNKFVILDIVEGTFGLLKQRHLVIQEEKTKIENWIVGFRLVEKLSKFLGLNLINWKRLLQKGFSYSTNGF